MEIYIPLSRQVLHHHIPASCPTGTSSSTVFLYFLRLENRNHNIQSTSWYCLLTPVLLLPGYNQHFILTSFAENRDNIAMSYLFQHSAVGSVVHYIKHRSFDFSRTTAKAISSSSSTDDLPFPKKEAPHDVVGTELKQHQTSLVDWTSPTDPSNPQNWSLSHKVLITVVLCVYTFAVYVGSSIYSPAQPLIMEKFGVSHVAASLGIALYVLGYGLGCLLFSPLSEVPAIGRNPPYAISGFLFIILCIPTALVDNFAGLMVLRFLLGFMASPCLATAGASLGDIWTMAEFPFAVALWAAVATLGPALGPTLSAYAVESLGWRFSSWELLIIAVPIYILMLTVVPESSGPTILYYKAKRMREKTGNHQLMSDSERKQKNMKVSSLLFDALIKPWEINALDPAILFTTVYMGLCYGVYYSFFEVSKTRGRRSLDYTNAILSLSR
jgi:DHA1 family multidrug resistance protein-like MFS transporter